MVTFSPLTRNVYLARSSDPQVGRGRQAVRGSALKSTGKTRGSCALDSGGAGVGVGNGPVGAAMPTSPTPPKAFPLAGMTWTWTAFGYSACRVQWYWW